VLHARTQHSPCPPSAWYPLTQLPAMFPTLLLPGSTRKVLVDSSNPALLPVECLPHFQILWSGLTSPSIHFPFSCSISHVDAGGVLDGVWEFKSNIPFDFQLPKLPPCSLLQIISPTTNCSKNLACQPPERTSFRSTSAVVKITEGLIDCRGLLPLRNPSAKVLCPSSFVPSGWVSWPLSKEELHRAFDVPQKAIPAKHDALGIGEAYQEIWQHHPPIKVLQRAFLQWSRETIMQYLPDLSSDFVRPGTLAMYTPSEAQDIESTFISAIKADNAENPTYLWNDRIWELGIHDANRVNTFRSKRDGQCPLDSIRALFLRVWRKRVRKSLLRYLANNYGSNWMNSKEATLDIKLGRDCIARTAAADWWE
jgi:hypothetical protein